MAVLRFSVTLVALRVISVGALFAKVKPVLSVEVLPAKSVLTKTRGWLAVPAALTNGALRVMLH